MSPERWQQVGDIFEQALQLPTSERESYVQNAASDTELRHEVNALLASHVKAAGQFVEAHVRNAVVSFGQELEPPLRRIGPYRLVREIGRGGMGTVYLAERDDDQYQAKVAIKLVRPGMDTEFLLSRFRHERQTLARLSHPNIARLLDGGATESGLPYLVMEYIDGQYLTEYARSRVLSTDDRVRIFLDVCAAVDYAHRNFVVHRDLKPGNILVEPGGVPKLLDFGISKLLRSDQGTRAETIASVLTPDYASREQVRGGPVTPASDIYSLGVVLFELLTGALPHDLTNLSPQAIEREICEGRVALPSAAAQERAPSRRMEGDLDNIILRALEIEPERRYESAARMAEDLRRLLAHEPVEARPATLQYRVRKFVRRNRIQVAAGIAVFAALGAGLAASLYQVQIAQQRLDQVRMLAGRLVFDVHDAVQNLPGSTRARQLIVKTGLEYLDSVSGSAKGNARAEGEMAVAYRKLGDAEGYVLKPNLGNTAAAMASYRKALGLAEDAAARAPENLAIQTERLVIYERLGTVEAYTGHGKDALRTFEEGLRVGTQFAGSGNADLKAARATLYLQASDVSRNMSAMEKALQSATESVRLHEEIARAGKETPELTEGRAAAYASLGMAESRLNRFQDALAHFRRGAADMEMLVASDAQNVSWKRNLMLAYGHVADVLGSPTMPSLKDAGGALEMYRKAAGIGRGLYREDASDERAASDYAIALSRVATVMDDRDEAGKEELLRESLRVLREGSRMAPKNVSVQVYLGFVNSQLGDVLQRRGDRPGARRAYLDSVASAETSMKLGQTSSLITYITSHRKLAGIAVAQGDRREALELARLALDAVEGQGAAPRMTLPRAYGAMGFTYAALLASPLRQDGDLGQATDWLQKSLESWRQAQSDSVFGEPHRREMREVETALAKLARSRKK